MMSGKNGIRQIIKALVTIPGQSHQVCDRILSK
jgi:hypothetical protein